jgi:alanyl-tRNA synthetase
MTVSEVRKKYLDFFKKKGHVIVPSSSLVPENDPTTLFTGSGMQPMVPYLLGKTHPAGLRLADSQKCFRAMDIDEVGDNRHTTFFEMLGNWSFGDYFKKEQLGWFFEFLVDEVGLDPEKLFVTVFAGDERANLLRDTESADIWKKLFSEKKIAAKDVLIGSEADGYKKGMQGGRIFYYDARKNWWSRAGVPENMPPGEPGGADSEVFYDFGTEHDKNFGEYCHPNCDCGRFLEIGNSVFMEYVKNTDGSFAKLPRRNVDFGGGLERIAAASNNNPDVFKINVFNNTRILLEEATEKKYEETPRDFRVILDHIRAAVFLLSDGVIPSNTERGYLLRRLIRRAVRFADNLATKEFVSTTFGTGDSKMILNESVIARVAETFIQEYKASYPEGFDLIKYATQIVPEIKKEESKFRGTLKNGLKELLKMSMGVWQKSINGEIIESAGLKINGENLFLLYSTYGFPFELSLEEINNIKSRLGTYKIEPLSIQKVEELRNEFNKSLQKHQELSRSGSEKKFKGGLADTSDMSVKYHTATHLLHQALREVLGNSVFQKGSNITPERLRFDFSFDRKMTDEEKKKVEAIVDAQIAVSLPVTYQDLPLEEAEKLGAIGLFEEKYGDKVRVYSIGEGKKRFSMEFCGGPHVENTSKLGDGGKKFKIEKEEATSAGVRRIRAVLK